MPGDTPSPAPLEAWSYPTFVLPTYRPPTVQDAKDYALEQLGPEEYACLDWIVMHESRWDPLRWNGKGSGAYGIPQAKPGDKMASMGDDWLTNPVTQVQWMIWYTSTKYGSACGAMRFWLSPGHGWY
jgi:hypothetical protein